MTASAQLEANDYQFDSYPLHAKSSRGIEAPTGNLAKAVQPTTSDAVEDLEGVSIKVASKRLPLERFYPAKIETVRLSVVEVSGETVECQTYVGERNVTLQLARGMFPVAPAFGMSFDLSMQTESGVRRPILRTAPPNANAHASLKAEIAALLDRL